MTVIDYIPYVDVPGQGELRSRSDGSSLSILALIWGVIKEFIAEFTKHQVAKCQLPPKKTKSWLLRESTLMGRKEPLWELKKWANGKGRFAGGVSLACTTASILISWTSAFHSQKGRWAATNEVNASNPFAGRLTCFKVGCIKQNETFPCTWLRCASFPLGLYFPFGFVFSFLVVFIYILGLKLSSGQRDFKVKNKIIST